MGFVVLWIESLATSLLFVATCLACIAQLKPRQSQWVSRGFAAATACLGALGVVAMVLGIIDGHVVYALSAMAFIVAATIGACWALLRGQWLAAATTSILLVPLAIYATPVALLAVIFRFSDIANSNWFVALVALVGAYVASAIALIIWGLRQSADAPGVRAATWRRGRLAVALAIMAGLHLMTLWNLDLAARQQMAAMRIEAGALALSIAPPRLADGENAAIIYLQAFEAMGRGDAYSTKFPLSGWQWEKPWQDAWNEKWKKWQEGEKVGFDVHDPELRRFLKRQAPALALLRRASAVPGCVFDRDYGRPTIWMPLPEVDPMRTGARLLALDALCRTSDKDYGAAVEDVNAIFRLAQHIGAEPILVSQHVAVDIEEQAIDVLRDILASGPLPDKALGKIDIPSGLAYRMRLRPAYRLEEAFRLTTYGQVAEQLLIEDSGAGGLSISKASWLAPFYRLFLMADDVAVQNQFAVQLDEAIQRPYAQAMSEMEKTEEELLSKPGGVLTRIFLPRASLVVKTMTLHEARRHAVRLGLALYAYRAAKGKFPDKLADLAPEFIAAVPQDPFDGQPMRFTLAGNRATVYSVGPDLKDDKGEALRAEITGDVSFVIE